MQRLLGAVVAVLLIGGGATLAVVRGGDHRTRVAIPAAAATSTTAAPATTTTVPATTTTSAATTTTAAHPDMAIAGSSPVTLAGCPPPPYHLPPPPPPWHPSVLVPESSLPAETAPAPWTSNTAALSGKGMWVYEYGETEGGNARAIVEKAAQSGLKQLWVRVGDSPDGFYGSAELAALVPAAHAAGIAIIAWGFPYLYDPLGDARWTEEILNWRGPGGQRVDGFTADIERSTEGVALDERRVSVYLGAVRQAAGNALLIATVYPPLPAYWNGNAYPYAAIARYVDAFAPMVYWECTDPGADARQAVSLLGTLRPVYLIGQAYNMGSDGGRAVSPSGAELDRFMTVGRQSGAVGASFYVWQTMTDDEWSAVSSYRW